MPDSPLNLLDSKARSEWVRLRTLINLRWLAIFGQGAAVLFATLQLELMLNLGMCILAIGASVVFNIASMIVYPENKRLSERETTLTLLFDLSQLVFLLYLTGGLNNPFALLILAPVTISATALRLRPTIFLGLMAILLISIVANFFVPLRTHQGFILSMPHLFVSGFWVSLVIGVVFLAAYARRVTYETHSMSQALIATQIALNREQQLTDLGGVVAAAAHEMGTPLATIKLASSELMDELENQPDLKNDALLIRDQADRCRDILRDMGRIGKEDMHLRHVPISAVIHDAAQPHEDRGKKIHFSSEAASDTGGHEPQIWRQPEVLHGLRNLVQNAVDFAKENVWVDIRWTGANITICIADDGDGYPIDLISKIGDPFVRKRRPSRSNPSRPEYEGMGLGLFIAKTLLERTGAELTFANGSDPSFSDDEDRLRKGAIVEVIWPRDRIEKSIEEIRAPLGENIPLEI